MDIACAVQTRLGQATAFGNEWMGWLPEHPHPTYTTTPPPPSAWKRGRRGGWKGKQTCPKQSVLTGQAMYCMVS